MRILLFGGSGQLGWDLQRVLPTLCTIITPTHNQVNLLETTTLPEYISKVAPDIIINAAAYTNVDRAESEPDIAYTVNGLVPGILADCAKKNHVALIHISTDYVFDGTSTIPYVETDPTNPINVYGRSKLDGELKIKQNADSFLIFRTSWLYSLHHDCFVTRMLNLAMTKSILKVVDDQTGSPTWSRFLAELIGQVTLLARNDPYEWVKENSGIFHLAGEGYVSRCEFTQKMLLTDPKNYQHACKQVIPVPSSEFPTPALRPTFSALSCQAFYDKFNLRLPQWDTAINLALAERLKI